MKESKLERWGRRFLIDTLIVGAGIAACSVFSGDYSRRLDEINKHAAVQEQEFREFMASDTVSDKIVYNSQPYDSKPIEGWYKK